MQQGSGTLVVSLPSKWAKKYGLKKGDTIKFDEENGRLILSTEKAISTMKKEMTLKTTNETAIRWIMALAHKTGYDELEIFFDNPAIIPMIQKTVVNELPGYMIIEQSDKRCLVKAVSQALESEYENTQRRAFLVGLSLAESSLQMIKEKNYKNLTSLLSLELTNNQLSQFCERILNKHGYKEPNKTTYAYVVIWNLEKVVDEYRDICKKLAEAPNVKLSNETIAMFEKTNNFFKKYYEIFYKKDINELANAIAERKKIKHEIYELMEQKKGIEHYVLLKLSFIHERVSDFSGSFVGLMD